MHHILVPLSTAELPIQSFAHHLRHCRLLQVVALHCCMYGKHLTCKRPHPGTQILSQIPEGGEGNRGQMPHICSGSPPLGLNIDRCITRSQQLFSKSFLLPDIEISSFSLSCPLLQSFNRQASKRNNLAEERVPNVLGVVEAHLTHTKCPPLDIKVIIIIIIYFLASKIFLWRPFYN